MKNQSVIFILLFCNVLAFGQFNSSHFDKEYFLIGTLDDYVGHQQSLLAGVDSSCYQLVDIYYQEEKHISEFIYSLFKEEYPDLYITNNGAPRGIRLHSATLSEKINEYYDYSQPYFLNNSVSAGVLKKDKIMTINQKISFLAGAFLRNGKQTESSECILSIPNSLGKANLSEMFLKDIGCKNIFYKIDGAEYIPIGHWIFFEPSERFSNIIQMLEPIDKKERFIPELVEFLKSR